MRQKWTIFAMAALLAVGLTGCGSANNRTVDEPWPGTYAVQPDGETGDYDYNTGTGGGNGTIGGNGAQRGGGDSAVDGYGGTGGTNSDKSTGAGDNGGNGNNNGTGNNGANGDNAGNNGNGILGDVGDGIDDAMDSVGNGIGDVMNGVGDTLTGNDDDNRYQDMVNNGRVHDSDGYLLDGENRHD